MINKPRADLYNSSWCVSVNIDRDITMENANGNVLNRSDFSMSGIWSRAECREKQSNGHASGGREAASSQLTYAREGHKNVLSTSPLSVASRSTGWLVIPVTRV